MREEEQGRHFSFGLIHKIEHGIGDGRRLAAAAIGGRTGRRAGAVRADLEAAPEAGGKWHLDCNSVPHRFRASLRP